MKRQRVVFEVDENGDPDPIEVPDTIDRDDLVNCFAKLLYAAALAKSSYDRTKKEYGSVSDEDKKGATRILRSALWKNGDHSMVDTIIRDGLTWGTVKELKFIGEAVRDANAKLVMVEGIVGSIPEEYRDTYIDLVRKYTGSLIQHGRRPFIP